MIVDQVIQDPGTGASADDQHKVFPMTSPGIPETFQRSDKSGSWCIKPGKFIDKHDLPLPVIDLLEPCFEYKKRFHPACGNAIHHYSMAQQRVIKMIQLSCESTFFLYFNRGKSGMFKGKFPFKGLINKERLPNTSAPIDGNKLSFLTFISFEQFLFFMFSSDHICSPHFKPPRF